MKKELFTEKFLTTNDALTLIEQEIEEVITWAESDIEQAQEFNDKSESRLAKLRLLSLKQALNAIKMSYKG